MCHGHPHHHPCSHQSVTWHYCPSALIDLETGYETPCSNVTFAVSQASNSECPLQNCEFKAKGGSWICCNCHQGPNTQGWCTFNRQQPVLERNYMSEEYSLVDTCDHGCCKNCTRDPSAKGPPPEYHESRKSGSGRKDKHKSGSNSHRRGAGHANRSQPAAATAEGESSSSAQYDVQLDYGAKKSKSSHHKKKNHK